MGCQARRIWFLWWYNCSSCLLPSVCKVSPNLSNKMIEGFKPSDDTNIGLPSDCSHPTLAEGLKYYFDGLIGDRSIQLEKTMRFQEGSAISRYRQSGSRRLLALLRSWKVSLIGLFGRARNLRGNWDTKKFAAPRLLDWAQQCCCFWIHIPQPRNGDCSHDVRNEGWWAQEATIRTSIYRNK